MWDEYAIRPVSSAHLLGDPTWPELLAAYAQECSIPALGPVQPQADLYKVLETSGKFQCFGVYQVEEQRLVGFAAEIVQVLPHYGILCGVTESLYVEPEARAYGCGTALLEALEAYARERGCVAQGYSARVGSQFEAMLDLVLAYERTNSVFMRPL